MVEATGKPFAWVMLGLVIATAVGAIALLFRRRGIAWAATAAGGAATALDDTPVSVETLEAEALAAEAAGDHDRAVRLRFRAGLLRLDRDAYAIQHRPGLTTREVRSGLQLPRFDGLADTFEAVAYGGERAAPSDTAVAREHWPVVVREAERAGRSS